MKSIHVREERNASKDQWEAVIFIDDADCEMREARGLVGASYRRHFTPRAVGAH